MPGSHFSARKFLCAAIFLGLLLPLQVLQAAAAPSSQTASAGPVRVVAPAQPESGPPDSPSGARRGHPGPVVLHRTKLQARAAWLASGADNLTYHKGPTERPRSTSYAIFWQPTGSYMSPTYQSLLERYFGDIGGSPLYNVATQYYDSGGNIVNSSAYATAWVDTSPYPSNTLTDADIENEVLNAVNTNRWPWSSPDVEYFVFTARGENSCAGSSCSFTQYCAYHSNFAATDGVTTANVLYANMPYAGTNRSACGAPSSPNNDIDADSTINLLSHEQMETVTDPLGTAWYDSAGSEIGDKCAWTFGTTGSNGADVTWNGHPYIVQQEWSNATSSCVVSYSTTLAVNGLNPTSGTTAGGTSVVVNGSGFSGATGVKFGSVAATSFSVTSDAQITAVAPPEAAGTVDVTVTGPTGTSASSSADQFTYLAAPTFTLTAAPTDQTVLPGGRTSYTLTLTAVNGYQSSVRLSASGLPARTGVSFSPNPLTPTGTGATSTLTVSTYRRASQGTYTFTVTATGNGVTQSISLQLTVQ